MAERLAEQIRWYDSQAKRQQGLYRGIKLVQILAAAAIPVLATLHASAWLTGSFGSAIVVLEGVQQLYQFHEYWISYRTACEALRSEMFLYEARAGHYRSEPDAQSLLAEQIQRITSEEGGRWSSRQSGDEKKGVSVGAVALFDRALGEAAFTA